MTFDIIFHVNGYTDDVLTLIGNKMYWSNKYLGEVDLVNF